MKRINNTFYILCVAFLFTTTIQAQSFLNKTLKVLDAVNEISKTSNASKEQNNKQNNKQNNVQSYATTQNGVRITAPFQDLIFKIRSCTANGSTVTLELTAKNREKNQHFMFGGDDQKVRTIVVDDQDNSYSYENIKISIGDKSPEVTQSELFPTNVPIKIHFYINEVDPSAQIITQFALRVEGFDTPITFYNIPIEHPTTIASTENNLNTSASTNGQATSKLKMIIGKWQLVTQTKDGKEIPFKSCILQFHNTPEDNLYNKNMTETIAGKTEESGYGILYKEETLIMSLPDITNDETDNGYQIKTVDTEKLILTFCYDGVPGINGELIFKRIN